MTNYDKNGNVQIPGMVNVGKFPVTDVEPGWIVSDGGFTFRVEYASTGRDVTVIAGVVLPGEYDAARPHARTLFDTHTVTRLVPDPASFIRKEG